jgi:ABC-2 type transport system permease protein
MDTLHDTWITSKRSLRHITRSLDTIITVLAMPIATMLMMVYVFGGAIDTGSITYIDFVVPGVIIMTVASGIAYAAYRLNLDIQKGFVNRFRSMPVASSSILGGQVVSSVLSNLFSVVMVMIVALIVGFRPGAGVVAWLLFSGLLLLFTTALTWLAVFFGLVAKSAEGAGAFSYIVLFLIFISPAFIPTGKMNPVLRAFANNQPMTPIIETMRSLLINGTAGTSFWLAVVWCVGLLIVSYIFALKVYKNKTT